MYTYYDELSFSSSTEFLKHLTESIPNPAHDTCAVSPPFVLLSGAGWYIGRCSFTYNNITGSWLYEPYDRISGYYKSEDDARDALSYHRWSQSVNALVPSVLAVRN